jgi:hypothetical protein
VQEEHVMNWKTFGTPITETDDVLVGPWRKPQQMLAAQQYDEHASIHDDSMAQRFGFQGGTIEGPTHFSQFAPLCEQLWGRAWFETGCISAHYRNPSFAGEELQAIVTKLAEQPNQVSVRMAKRDGTEVLRGSASVGTQSPPSALDRRLAELEPLRDPVMLRDVKVGMKTKRQSVRMDPDQNMGALYPFSLRQKLKVITEFSSLYEAAGTPNPWARAVIPMEMLSVLFQYRSHEDQLPIRGPAIGLFADQEIRFLRGPLFAGVNYEIEREVVAITASRRTESVWLRTKVFAADIGGPIATMLLNSAIIKESYAAYSKDYAELYPS